MVYGLATMCVWTVATFTKPISAEGPFYGFEVSTWRLTDSVVCVAAKNQTLSVVRGSLRTCSRDGFEGQAMKTLLSGFAVQRHMSGTTGKRYAIIRRQL